MGPVRQTILANLTLLVISVLAVILISEIALRFTPLRVFLGTNALSDYYQPDAQIGYTIRENSSSQYFDFGESGHWVWANELGCLDRPYQGKLPFMLLVGDSMTWGFTPFEKKWGTLLEQWTDTRVLKCGTPGYGTKAEHIKAQRIIRRIGHTPAVLLVGYYTGNDFEESYRFPAMIAIEGRLVNRVKIVNFSDGRRETMSDEELETSYKQRLQYCGYEPTRSLLDPLRCWFDHHSILYHLVKKVSLLRNVQARLADDQAETAPLIPFLTTKYPWVSSAWTHHLQEVQDLASFAHELNSSLVLVIIPTKEQVYENLRPQGWDYDWEQPNTILNATCIATGIHCIDLLPSFRQYTNTTDAEPLYWKIDSHLNIPGNIFAGLLVSEYLLQNKLVSGEDPEFALQQIERELEIFRR
ncbi:MAG TPA: hypothetical protein VJK52_01890 [Candidatus Nanoarchaeia archaeon]|nr:hypothetical protein [Candidatus Nanoarchaeia archaeon]